jgi:hypothetical protein
MNGNEANKMLVEISLFLTLFFTNSLTQNNDCNGGYSYVRATRIKIAKGKKRKFVSQIFFSFSATAGKIFSQLTR